MFSVPTRCTSPTTTRLLDHDTNANGLIDVSTLFQLDAIRHDLDGNGRVLSGAESVYGTAFPVVEGGAAYGPVACAGGCRGYELLRDLDFEDANSDGVPGDKSIWARGAAAAGISGALSEGWIPIGTADSGYASIFDGGHRVIHNLCINATTAVSGLFGTLSGSFVCDLGLEDVHISSSGSDVGSLAGRLSDDSCVLRSYSSGTVRGGHRSCGRLGRPCCFVWPFIHLFFGLGGGHCSRGGRSCWCCP